MKINNLTFQAIGPFPGKHAIDFDLLGDAALFLIDGPTGAGKSTIIDAITFALYKDTAGIESDKGRMRSQHAAPTTQTFVELTFTTGVGKYKLFRSPEYLRPMVRREGLTAEKAKTVLTQILPDGSEIGIADGHQEVELELQKIIQLSKEEFSQTVILPQGEFAKFLQADSSDREPLLKKIFNTELYTKISVELSKRSNLATKKVEAETAKITSLLNQLQGVLQLEEERFSQIATLSAHISNDLELQDNLEHTLNQLDNEQIQLQIELANAKNNRDAARKSFEDRKKESDARTRFDRAKFDLENADLEDQNLLEDVKSLDPRILTEVKLNLSDITFEFNWSELSTSLATTISTLSVAATAEAELGEKEVSLVESDEKFDSLNEVIKELEDQIKTSLPKAINDCKEEVKTNQKLANKRVAIEQSLQGIDESFKKHRELATFIEQLAPLETQVAEQSAAARKSEDYRKALVDSRLTDMAGELAEKLNPNDSCMVCGSTEHPNLATRKGSPVTEVDIQQAEDRANADRGTLDLLNQQLASLKTNIKSFQVSTNEPEEELTAKRQAMVQQLSEVDAADLELERLGLEITNLEAELVKANQELAKHKADQGNLDTAVKTLTESIEVSKKLIEESCGLFPSVQDRVSNLNALARLMSDLITAKESRAQLSGEFNLAKSAVDSLPKSENFADFESAKITLDDCEEIFIGKQSELDAKTTSIEIASDLRTSITSTLEARAVASEGTVAISKLANIAAGANDYKQTLQTYVLQTMFEDVVTAANTRFRTLLEGRYELQTSDELLDKRSKQGLNLFVFDNKLQTVRKASTLSGGESFCASLALALGLADIVQNNSGGIEINSLFIDEGFGSLDGERLDDVMNMLTHLRQEGRTVGVISHVEEMKNQILERIVVTPDKENGPSTLLVNWDLPEA